MLSVVMDHGFDFLPEGTFPVYTSSPGHGPGKGPGAMGPGRPCDELCAQ